MIAHRRKGWIGIDIGTHAVKVAQAERAASGLRVREAAVIRRRPASWDDEDPGLACAEEEIRSALGLGKGFSGRAAACVVSMSACNSKTLLVPAGNREELHAAVADQLQSAYGIRAEEHDFDFWTAQPPQNAPQQQSVVALAMRVPRVQTITGVLARLGLRCQVMDGLPAALARATLAMPGAQPGEAIAAVDWGMQTATFCAAVDGRPTFVRELRGCGFCSALESVRKALPVSDEEAFCLLAEHGLPDPRVEGRGEETQQVLADLLDEPLSAITAEIQRTQSFLATYRPADVPVRMHLFGGGAALKNAGPALASRSGKLVEAWQPAPDLLRGTMAEGYPAAVLGTAVALSSLAWTGD